MTIASPLLRVISPSPTVSKEHTALTFTDVLFGFVLFELFTRMAHLNILPGYVVAQLITATTLVVGSWIGFRTSQNRPRWEIKFINLPFVRFVLDQAMVVFYFRVATLTPLPVDKEPLPGALAHDTLFAFLCIFSLYALWDLGGMWMANARLWVRDPTVANRYKPLYPKVGDDDKATQEKLRTDWPALVITVVVWLIIGLTLLAIPGSMLDRSQAFALFNALTILLLLYRFAKQVKSTFRPVK